eukprot:g22937.t1
MPACSLACLLLFEAFQFCCCQFCGTFNFLLFSFHMFRFVSITCFWTTPLFCQCSCAPVQPSARYALDHRGCPLTLRALKKRCPCPRMDCIRYWVKKECRSFVCLFVCLALRRHFELSRRKMHRSRKRDCHFRTNLYVVFGPSVAWKLFWLKEHVVAEANGTDDGDAGACD